MKFVLVIVRVLGIFSRSGFFLPAGLVLHWCVSLLLLVGNCVAAPGAEFRQAVEPREWLFPRDHGAHPEFQTEWWYFTGNVATAKGRPFGYQFTIFRRSLRGDEDSSRTSAWATSSILMGHVALTDVDGRRFYHDSAAVRPALGMAGASTETLNAHLGDWQVEPEGEGWRVSVTAPEFRYRFSVRAAKPPVLNGTKGLDQKGPQPGQASYYYSMTRLMTTGTVTLAGRDYPVSGTSWMDHEFGSNQLSPDQVGWDWFALQLSDGSELMLYNLRKSDGTLEPNSGGTLVKADGTARSLKTGEYRVEVTGHWKSPHSSARYPARWKISVPSEGIALEVSPRLADQELRTSVPADISYWEGSVNGSGTHKGTAVRHVGYVEMTGYAESMAGRL